MKTLTVETLHTLPFHDSDFLGLKITQQDDGATDLTISIAFYEGEFENLDSELSSIINSEGKASLLFQNCEEISISAYYTVEQRDAFDYINIFNNDVKQENTSRHIEVVFISGSKIKCMTKSIILIPYIHI
nr:hypothetical protein [uncultured Desulfobacter sp.]